MSLLKYPFVKQAIYAVLYYVIGYFVTWMVYKLSGKSYAHGPNLFHLIGFLILVGGLIWAFITILSLHRKQGHAGALLVHLIVLGGFIFMVSYEGNEAGSVLGPSDEDVITIYKDSTTNSAFVVDGTGDTLYLQQNDSILINKVDTYKR